MFRIQGGHAGAAQRTVKMGDKEKPLRVIVPSLRKEMVRYQRKKLSVASIRILLEVWQPLAMQQVRDVKENCPPAILGLNGKIGMIHQDEK